MPPDLNYAKIRQSHFTIEDFAMKQEDFEGSLILEKLALIDKVDEFFAAVDEDNFASAKSLMKAAGVPHEVMVIAIRMMKEGDQDH